MAVFISEVLYEGGRSTDFIEVAATKGADLSSWSVVQYDKNGGIESVLTFGDAVQTTGGKDVYLFDPANPQFADIKSNDAIALVDGAGNVVQFISFKGETVHATEGPAAGMTSQSVGTSGSGTSVETSDEGVSYQAQTSPTPGSVPCYAPGSLIRTPGGLRPVESLRPGDMIDTRDNGPQAVRWVHQGVQPLDSLAPDRRPVMIRAGALGPGVPLSDLVVSPQHRIFVGADRQLAEFFGHEALVPAKALTGLRRIRRMFGKSSITWCHFACDRHEIARANGCWTESLLLGPVIVAGLRPPLRAAVRRIFGASRHGRPLNGAPARPCLTVNEARHILSPAEEFSDIAA